MDKKKKPEKQTIAGASMRTTPPREGSQAMLASTMAVFAEKTMLASAMGLKVMDNLTTEIFRARTEITLALILPHFLKDNPKKPKVALAQAYELLAEIRKSVDGGIKEMEEMVRAKKEEEYKAKKAAKEAAAATISGTKEEPPEPIEA